MTEQTPRVVVGYDGGPDADHALTWAIATARHGPAPLVVLVAASAMDPVLDQDFHVATERVAADRLARAEKVLAEAGLADAAAEVRHGPVLRVLLTAVTPADLLVVGSTGHPALVEAVGGSVSQHLARRARCTVVVVRPAPAGENGPVVVGVDGSPASLAAVRFGCERARSTGAPVVLAHGYRTSPFTGGATDAGARLAAWVAPVRAAYPDVEVTERAAAGLAGELLVGLSADAALVAVGARGGDPGADLFLGSVAHDVLHRAHCPVAVVR